MNRLLRERLSLPAHAAAYRARDLVTLWNFLSLTGKMTVIETALELVGDYGKQSQDVFMTYEHFTSTARWPTRKWRRAAGRDRLSAELTTAEGVEAFIRRVASDSFLADECVLWRVPLAHGHFAVGGRDRRIILTGICSTTHYDGIVAPAARARLIELVSLPPDTCEPWRATEIERPEWCEIDEWLDANET
jgi:hypothetical protein